MNEGSQASDWAWMQGMMPSFTFQGADVIVLRTSNLCQIGQKISGPFTIAHYFLLIVYYFSPIVRSKQMWMKVAFFYQKKNISREKDFSERKTILF